MAARFNLFVTVVVVVVTIVGCRKYKFTMHHRSGEGKESVEQQVIYATNDSSAYSKAMTIYFLALHAGDKMNENARAYIFKPVSYTLVDNEGRNLDSVLGIELRERIKNSKSSVLR